MKFHTVINVLIVTGAVVLSIYYLCETINDIATIPLDKLFLREFLSRMNALRFVFFFYILIERSTAIYKKHKKTS